MATSASYIPPGWTYNPSAFPQRLPIIILALIGSFIAVYLALFQYKVISHVWEPFFGKGSREILTSPTSFILPVSDAALGALAYLTDVITGAIGKENRWQRMPWIVIVFGFFVGPLSAISIGLVVAQPVLYGQWCTLCLISAVIAIVMVGPAMDEVLASLQYLKDVKRQGGAFWPAFWGARIHAVEYARESLQEKGGRMRVWPLWIAMAASVLLMIVPGLLKVAPPLANTCYIIAPILFSLSCIALWEATRGLRFLNLVLVAFLIVLAFIFSTTTQSTFSIVSVALAGGLASLIRIRRFHTFREGWRGLMEKE